MQGQAGEQLAPRVRVVNHLVHNRHVGIQQSALFGNAGDYFIEEVDHLVLESADNSGINYLLFGVHQATELLGDFMTQTPTVADALLLAANEQAMFSSIGTNEWKGISLECDI